MRCRKPSLRSMIQISVLRTTTLFSPTTRLFQQEVIPTIGTLEMAVVLQRPHQQKPMLPQIALCCA